jgi:hypothetical protein
VVVGWIVAVGVGVGDGPVDQDGEILRGELLGVFE